MRLRDDTMLVGSVRQQQICALWSASMSERSAALALSSGEPTAFP